MEIVGAVGVGSVIGWSAPVVRHRSPAAFAASLAGMAVTAGGIGLFFGVPAAAMAAATIVATAALNGGWREYLAANELRDS